MDSSITSLRDAVPEHGDGEIESVKGYVPPTISAEQVTAMHDLKLFLKAVADVNRLAILQELGREVGLSVLDLSDRLVLSQPLTSWHLHILKRARLVAPTHKGRQRIYRLNRERLQEYKELFNGILEL